MTSSIVLTLHDLPAQSTVPGIGVDVVVCGGGGGGGGCSGSGSGSSSSSSSSIKEYEASRHGRFVVQ